ncbi:Mkk1p [Rhizophagus irregularis DAOM 197198w]|uniref:Mkk1p n=1 Tax=Rhizophagus irregularis (strain DAOM 197198w) TaxID=1432141 RepID=A0A015K023_RHIIW|nr:Mkk1p [Rhizophagus irregularis DAOM 197198w]
MKIEIYGISQNPNTKDYIMVLQDKNYCLICNYKYSDINCKWCKRCETNKLITNWTSGNKKIDNFIQEKQLKIYNSRNIVFEWIPYNQFSEIKEIGTHDHITVYSAKWNNGPLMYDANIRKYKRTPDALVRFKCLLFKQESLTFFENLLLLFKEQNTTNEFLNKIKRYFMVNSNKIYGISQNPNSKEYLVILNGGCVKCGEIYTNILYGWCNLCHISSFKNNFVNWSRNELIDNFIQKMKLKIKKYDDIIFEWIPYNQFINVKKIGQNNFTTIYLAKWEDGPLEYNINTMQYERDPNRAITLKCLNNTRNMINEFLDKIKVNSIVKGSNVLNNIYGISQNPDTGNYIMVLHGKYFEKYFEGHCIKCDKIYTDIRNKWCKPCQIDYFKKFFTSINKEIDNFIQEMQLKINNHDDIVFEWIPYNQFNDIKRIGKGGFATVYSAIWKDGLLKYDINKNQYIRNFDTKVALKYLYNSQNITSEFLHEVKAYSINNSGKILKVYGISQDPNTKDFIMVLQYAEGRNFDYWIYNNYKYFNWSTKLKILNDIISGLKEIHQKQMVHHDFHVGNILFNEIFVISSNIKIYISDMGLCREVGNVDKTTIYGVMPYVAPEVLRGKPYTLASDIYSFGMIMYFVATEKQPFANCAHDELLALDICKGIRPEINESEAPKCYIDLMKKCWDTDPNNRPDAIKVEDSIRFLYNSYFGHSSINKDYEIEKQFKEAETYRRNNLSFFKYSQLDTHPQAIYTSRLLNPFTKVLEKYDKSECLECEIIN